MKARALSLALTTLAMATSVSAQIPLRYSLFGGAFSTNLNTQEPAGSRHLSGFSAGGGASLAYGRLGLGVRYLEGSLSPGSGGTDRDIVEGEFMLSVRALSWLTLRLGPHVRSFIVNEATERWFFWEGRVRTEARLGTERVTSSLEIWQVLSADVNTVEPFDKGQGIEGNLKWEPSGLPLWFGLGYRIDRSRLGGGSRTEVLEHVLFRAGFGRGN